MKWLSTQTDSRRKVYELGTNREKLATLTYHPASGTVRISTDDEKRVFSVGREGFIRSRIVLRNEYGIRIAQLLHDGGPEDNQGIIEIAGEEFNYTLKRGAAPEAFLYKNNDVLAACELPQISKDLPENSDQDLLLLTLCWYISATVKRQQVEFA